MRASVVCGVSIAIFFVALGVAAGCASVPAPVASCPPVKAYSGAQESALATAVVALPADSPLVGAMADYAALRSAARACAKR